MDQRDESAQHDERVTRPGILIPRKLWGRVRMLAFDEGVRPQVVVTRILTKALKEEKSDA